MKKQTIELLDKDFKTIILNIFKELKENTTKIRKTIYEQNDNINKETEI